MVDSDVAECPDELRFNRAVGGQDYGRRDIEVDVAGEEVLGGARQRHDIPEAEVQSAHVREHEPRLRRSDRQIEEVLAVARDDARVVHQHDDAERSGLLDEGQHAWVGYVELLRVRVKLDDLDALARYPLELVQCGRPVVGMDCSNRHHRRMLRRQRHQRVVLTPGVLDVSRQSLVRPAEPHPPNPATCRFAAAT